MIQPMDLARFDDDEFHGLVVGELHGESSDEFSRALRADEVSVERWRDSLIDMVRGVDESFTAVNERFAAGTADEDEVLDVKRRGSTFKRHAERALREANQLRKAFRTADYSQEVTDERDLLVAAIRRHRDQCGDSDRQCDDELWAVLEKVGKPSSR